MRNIKGLQEPFSAPKLPTSSQIRHAVRKSQATDINMTEAGPAILRSASGDESCTVNLFIGCHPNATPHLPPPG